MKLTKEQYKQFKIYVEQGIENIKLQSGQDIVSRLKTWLAELNGERLTHFNALNALKLCRKAGDDAWFWTQSLNLNDNHWATIGRKYFKEFN